MRSLLTSARTWAGLYVFGRGLRILSYDMPNDCSTWLAVVLGTCYEARLLTASSEWTHRRIYLNSSSSGPWVILRVSYTGRGTEGSTGWNAGSEMSSSHRRNVIPAKAAFFQEIEDTCKLGRISHGVVHGSRPSAG